MIYRITQNKFAIVMDISNLVIDNEYIIEGINADMTLVGIKHSKPLKFTYPDRVYTLHDSIMSSVYTVFDAKRAMQLIVNPSRFDGIKEDSTLYVIRGDLIQDDVKRDKFLVKKIYSKEEFLKYDFLL